MNEIALEWNEWNSISSPTSKEMKEIHFIGKLGYSTMAPWGDPAHLKQPGSYHLISKILDGNALCLLRLKGLLTLKDVGTWIINKESGNIKMHLHPPVFGRSWSTSAQNNWEKLGTAFDLIHLEQVVWGPMELAIQWARRKRKSDALLHPLQSVSRFPRSRESEDSTIWASDGLMVPATVGITEPKTVIGAATGPTTATMTTMTMAASPESQWVSVAPVLCPPGFFFYLFRQQCPPSFQEGFFISAMTPLLSRGFILFYFNYPSQGVFSHLFWYATLLSYRSSPYLWWHHLTLLTGSFYFWAAIPLMTTLPNPSEGFLLDLAPFPLTITPLTLPRGFF